MLANNSVVHDLHWGRKRSSNSKVTHSRGQGNKVLLRKGRQEHPNLLLLLQQRVFMHNSSSQALHSRELQVTVADSVVLQMFSSECNSPEPEVAKQMVRDDGICSPQVLGRPPTPQP